MRVSVLHGRLSYVETNHTMKFRTTLFTAVVLSLFVTTSSFALTSRQEPNAPAPPPPQDQSTPSNQTTLPPQSAQPQGSAPLRVMVDKSLLINTTERLKRISVTDPTIATVRVITPTQILVHGLAP